MFLGLTAVFADQLSYLTKPQADPAVILLKQQQKVILWCACCDNDPKIVVIVKDIKVKETEDQQFYQISITGVDNSGNEQNYDLDLAYVFVKRNGKWHCAGNILDFKCNPCTKPFKY